MQLVVRSLQTRRPPWLSRAADHSRWGLFNKVSLAQRACRIRLGQAAQRIEGGETPKSHEQMTENFDKLGSHAVEG